MPTGADAGSSQTLPVADAGPQDAGPIDAGPPPDCVGLVPSKVGPAYTFDVPYTAGQTCTAATSDGNGVMAAEAHDANGVTWNLFGTNGARQASFRAGPIVFGQPTGFEGYSAGVDQYWTEGGAPNYFAAVEKNALIQRAYGSGTIAIGATSSNVVVHKVDATGNEITQVPIALVGTPLAGAEDASGAVLAVVGVGGTAKGVWFDLTHGSAGTPFDLGAASSAAARGLIGGGVAVALDGHWKAVVNPNSATLVPAPAWLRDGAELVIVRGAKAYGLVEKNGVDVVSPQGSACGPVTFGGVTSVSVGFDGTVIGSTGAGGCTKVFWLGALK
ncbi:MAG: hypothetical protein LC689_20450 [Myxococcales bacterium]|nr:hypothetical protein [Myxococcales bacterium]